MQVFPIGDPSEIAPARRGINALAVESGFSAGDAGRAALVATEIGTNIIKHGGGGELLARKITSEGRNGLELIGLDRGPGIADLGKCLRDGYSTGGSPGTGLGAIERMSQCFEIYSRPDQGTAVFSQLWLNSRTPTERVQIGAVMVPKPGESICGDAWCYHERVEGFVVAGIDGLGHGDAAQEAAAVACQVFDREKHRPLLRLMELMHEALRPTRGAAVTLMEVDWDAGRATCVAVGNVTAAIASGTEIKRIAANNGIVGHVMSRPRELQYPYPPGSVLVLHSDGLTGNWQLDRYPGLIQHHPALIAGVLYRDHKRGRDDVLVVAIRRSQP
jgi:anti-sigma regulatory factor (Ser/Thr protein kinase)